MKLDFLLTSKPMNLRRQILCDWFFMLEDFSWRWELNKMLAEGRRAQSQIDALKKKLLADLRHWVFIEPNFSPLLAIYVPIQDASDRMARDFHGDQFIPCYIIVERRQYMYSGVLVPEMIRIIPGELKTCMNSTFVCRVKHGSVTRIFNSTSSRATSDAYRYNFLFWEWAATKSEAALTALERWDELMAERKMRKEEYSALMVPLRLTEIALSGLRGNSPNYRLLYEYLFRVNQLAGPTEFGEHDDPAFPERLLEVANNFPIIGGRKIS